MPPIKLTRNRRPPQDRNYLINSTSQSTQFVY